MRTQKIPLHMKRGFTLIEMIAVVILLAVFMVVISDLFVVAYRGQKDSMRRDDLIRRVDGTMTMLRRDVWNASQITLAGGQLRLDPPNGAAIIWDFSGGTSLVRHEGEATRSWTNLPALSVNGRGPLVTLAFHEHDPESITFTSQIMLAGGER